MLLRTLLGALIASALVFGWGFVYWMQLPFVDQVIQKLDNEEETLADLQDRVPRSGVYAFPAPVDPQQTAEFENWQQRHAGGPVGILVIDSDGRPAMGTKTMLFGFLQTLAAAIAAGIVLAASDVFVYAGRVMIVVWMGIFAALFVTLSDVVWYCHPIEFFWLRAGHLVSSAIILGLVMGFFVRPPQRQAAS